VVIPTLNEARNLEHVLPALPEALHEVILVDGGSSDDTLEVAQRLRPSIRITRQTRSGKGNALACGFAACSGDIIVMLDADGSADPDEITRFVDALVDGADFAKGSRFLADGGSADITHVRLTRSPASSTLWLTGLTSPRAVAFSPMGAARTSPTFALWAIVALASWSIWASAALTPICATDTTHSGLRRASPCSSWSGRRQLRKTGMAGYGATASRSKR